jgi:hypothetical protein
MDVGTTWLVVLMTWVKVRLGESSRYRCFGAIYLSYVLLDQLAYGGAKENCSTTVSAHPSREVAACSGGVARGFGSTTVLEEFDLQIQRRF